LPWSRTTRGPPWKGAARSKSPGTRFERRHFSDAIRKLYLAAAEKPGAIARKDGDADAALAGAARKVEAAYEVPFLAHATMEPMNCVADVRTDGCDIYAPTQFQTFTQNTSAKITGLKPEQVRVYTTYVGGGFGRRAEQDFIAEAVEISKSQGRTGAGHLVSRRRHAA